MYTIYNKVPCRASALSYNGHVCLALRTGTSPGHTFLLRWAGPFISCIYSTVYSSSFTLYTSFFSLTSFSAWPFSPCRLQEPYSEVYYVLWIMYWAVVCGRWFSLMYNSHWLYITDYRSHMLRWVTFSLWQIALADHILSRSLWYVILLDVYNNHWSYIVDYRSHVLRCITFSLSLYWAVVCGMWFCLTYMFHRSYIVHYQSCIPGCLPFSDR